MNHFQLIVIQRIADHKAAEDKRLESERDRIRQEADEHIALESAQCQIRASEESIGQADVVPPAPSVPMQAAPRIEAPDHFSQLRTAGMDVGMVDAYLATINDGPKKKAEIKKHLDAFLVWHPCIVSISEAHHFCPEKDCFSKLRTAGLIVGKNTGIISAVEELVK